LKLPMKPHIHLIYFAIFQGSETGAFRHITVCL